MHEIGALKKAVDLCNQIALDNKIESIKTITLEVGELTGYLPIFFEKYYPVVKGQATCNDCDAFYNVMKCQGICPKCGSRNKTIISGQQFLVKNIEY